MPPRRKDDSAIAAAYASGLSGPKVAQKFGCDLSLVYICANRNGIPSKAHSEVNRRHLLNEAAFDCKSPERDYWVGFLLADGCNIQSDGYKRLSVSVSEKDSAHLVLLKKFLGSSHPISTKKYSGNGYPGSKPLSRLSIYSAKIIDRLESFGLVQRKSGLEKASPGMAGSVDFWRGYIDGDGFVSINKKFVPEIGIVGGADICGQFSDFCLRLIGKRSTIFRNNKIWTSSMKCNAAVDLAKRIYADKCIALRRKQIAAHAIVAAEWKNRGEWFSKRTGKHPIKLSFEIAEEIRRRRSMCSWSIGRLAEEYNVKTNTIYRVLSGSIWAAA